MKINSLKLDNFAKYGQVEVSLMKTSLTLQVLTDQESQQLG